MASNFGSFESSTIITSLVTANWFWFGVTLNDFFRKLTDERLCRSFIGQMWNSSMVVRENDWINTGLNRSKKIRRLFPMPSSLLCLMWNSVQMVIEKTHVALRTPRYRSIRNVSIHIRNKPDFQTHFSTSRKM